MFLPFKLTGFILDVAVSVPNVFCNSLSRLKDEWYRVVQTDIITFPEEICLKLLLFLNANNKMQPPSLRTANGFDVSSNNI